MPITLWKDGMSGWLTFVTASIHSFSTPTNISDIHFDPTAVLQPARAAPLKVSRAASRPAVGLTVRPIETARTFEELAAES